jgi:hypothetical protein
MKIVEYGLDVKIFYKLSMVFLMLSNDVNALSLNTETILLGSFLGIPVVLIIANIFLMLLFIAVSKGFQYLSSKKSKSVKGGFIKSVFMHRDVK